MSVNCKAEHLLLLIFTRFYQIITIIMRRKSYFIPLITRTTSITFLTIYVRDFPSSLFFTIYLFIKSFKISSCYQCKRSRIFIILEFSIHFLLPEFQSSAFHLLQDTFCNVSLLKFFIAALQTTSTKLFIYNVFCFGMPYFIKVPDIHVLTICCKQ